jgi:predicted enzyme related to lactoylglutathione lyase
VLNLNSVMIGTTRLDELSTFYQRVLGEPAEMVDDENGFRGWQVGAAYFGLLRHSEMGGRAKDAGRIMLNFETADVAGEFQRIVGLGGAPVREPYEIGGGWVATLADPDGNYFQLMSPMMGPDEQP